MFKKRAVNIAMLVSLILWVAPDSFAGNHDGEGRSSTVLPDGRTLLVGAFSADSVPTSSVSISLGDGTFTRIGAELSVARAGHTATVLPNGTVLIFGGVGSDGRVVTTSELFDPATQQLSVLGNVTATPRAFHTATVLTDGSLLIAGGIIAGGGFPDDVQIWDYRTRKALSFHAILKTPREGHTATLLSDGSVRISGGTNHFGAPVTVDEIYDQVSRRFRYSTPSTDRDRSNAGAPPRVEASIPEDGANKVSTQALIAVRFSRIVDVASISRKTFFVAGPDDKIIEAKVTAAEAGRLAFLVPAAPLLPGTTYTVKIQDVSDRAGEKILETLITFTTEGEPPESSSPDFLENGPSTTQWQQLPPLQASSGTTALAGQTLKINGWPLEHVTLEMDGKKTLTDSTGRFLLSELTAGHHVLWIVGTTANHSGTAYGVYEVGVTILPNRTNVLSYTIWMTRLDMAHAVNIPSPTNTETVLTNPYLPGLELHIPPNTVITDHNGRVVRQVSITPVPLDKPPFPLPAGVEVPIYFTIQPGGGYLSVRNPGNGPKGARLVYPNAFNFQPGARFNFWNYDADAKGWYIYGQGNVSPDGHNIVPDPGVEVYEFTGAMVAGPGDAPGKGKPAGKGKTAADPVDLSTGQFIYSKTDLVLPDTLPISFTRTYITNDSFSRSFGIGALHNYDIYMVGDRPVYTYQEMIMPDGGRIRFDRISPGNGSSDAVYVHTTSHTQFYGALLTWNTDPTLPGAWKMVLRDGTIYSFPDSSGQDGNPECQALSQIKDRYGNTIKLTRQPTPSCLLTRITSPNGRYINLAYDAQKRITQASDISGRTVGYAYDLAGRLSTVTDPSGAVTTYTYDDQNRMVTITDPRGIVYLTNTYDSAGRVLTQTQADGGVYSFAWTAAQPAQSHFYQSPGSGGGGGVLVSNGCWGLGGYSRNTPGCGEGYMPLVAQVDVTDPRGYIRRIIFGSAGYATSDTHALGQPEQQTTTYTYYADNLLQSVTDTLGRTTSYDYDGLGNTTRITRLDGTPNAVTTTMAHTGPFNQVSSVTNALGRTTTFGYDAHGNLASITDPLSHQATFTYNSAGQLASLTDPLNNTVQFSYFGGDLVSIMDPLGNISSQFTDAIGRVTSATDAQGNVTKYQYSNLNLLTQVTDGQGNNTVFSYDPNGNLLSLTDALNHTTSWTYDSMDRVQTRTDPLLRHENHSYDLSGNLASSTDRKGQVTSLTYDALNRLTFLGYNTVVNGGVTSYESTTAYTYDAGDRMTQAVDSVGGTITEAYDNLDRLTSETTAHGVISYGYDNANRRTSMTLAGQPQVNYTWDSANRLTQIAQATSTIGFVYDNAGRRTTLTLSNGVNLSYAYDNNSRVTGITYRFNANTLGNLAYAYDVLGRRALVGGSFAQTGMPSTVTSATYDAANELLNWNGINISYDANGSMLSDGSNIFTWNARNEVATLNGKNLQYDAYGRRIQNLLGLFFLYDGVNAAQELSANTGTTNLLSGSVDEFFSRADSLGTSTPLQDALGSTIALVDASGNVVTQYSYDPFGNTTVSGANNANEFQYTGRENEGNGLHYLRARYYSPVLHRFISEDPLGFVGSGSNFYAYAFNNPISLSDPSGLNPAVAPGIVAVLEGLGYTQVEIDAAIAYLGAGGAETAGICASTVICGLIVLDTGLAINDGWQFYRLGVAYDWWGQPKPQPLAGRGCKSPRHSEGDCDDMFEADLETCRALKSRACYDQAMQRYSACQAGKTIPPFPFRMPN